MTEKRTRPGLSQGVMALAVVATIVAIVVSSSWSRNQTPGRLAIASILFFAIALMLGSRGMVGATTVPILASALFSTAGLDETAWIRAAAVGVLWFVAAELAWDSIERRDGLRRTRAYTSKRVDETTTVVLVSLGVSGAVFLLADRAPLRTVFVIGIALTAVAWAALAVAGHLRNREKPRS